MRTHNVARKVICKLVIVESYNKNFRKRRGPGQRVVNTAEVCLSEKEGRPV